MTKHRRRNKGGGNDNQGKEREKTYEIIRRLGPERSSDQSPLSSRREAQGPPHVDALQDEGLARLAPVDGDAYLTGAGDGHRALSGGRDSRDGDADIGEHARDGDAEARRCGAGGAGMLYIGKAQGRGGEEES